MLSRKSRKTIKKSRERYRNLSKEEKEKKQQYGHELYKISQKVKK